MLSFPTSQLVDNSLSLLPVRPTGLSFSLRLTPLEYLGRHRGPSPHVRLLCQPHGGCQPALSFTDGSFPRLASWAYALIF